MKTFQAPEKISRKSLTGNSKNNSKKQTNTRQELEMYKLIFDILLYGGIVTDVNGYITHFNKPYGQFLGLDPEAQIGKHCTEVIENTRMHIVAKTGIPEINMSHRIKGQDMVVQRIPIKKKGKVIAVFGQVMFKDVRDVKKLAEKLSLLENKVEFYEKELLALRSTRFTLDSIIGLSDVITSLKEEALKAAVNQYPVLITGETGTGKELLAQAIHNASERKLHPFIRINCAAIPKDLLESELFGYESGAFTGAKPKGKPGKFELAHKGTFLLDEIGDLPMEIQPKLLRVLEEKEFERVGGTSLVRTDFRLIAASNQNIEEMVSDGRFRKDLFYRLNVIPIYIPPLRERREDVIPLTRSMLRQIAQDLGLLEVKIDPQVEEALKNYAWPGNIRELSNVLERVSSTLDGDTIHLCDLPFYLYSSRKKSINSNHSSLKNVQTMAEREAIQYALASTNYNKAHAAKLLGIHRTLLYKKMKKYNLPINTDVNI
ncbi:MAG: sigma 54-interacting transcriptional regulator [Deltaproteobacteria bacterium]|nr:sigma 54-interacting transcriptional regulator [Deltaproteobacteria bacterium]